MHGFVVIFSSVSSGNVAKTRLTPAALIPQPGSAGASTCCGFVVTVVLRHGRTSRITN